MIAMLVSILPMPTPTRAAATFTVNSAVDAVDANPGDGFCDTGGGVCTLRAAIMEANHTPGGGATINFGLPGVVTYMLTIPKSGTDDEATGNLNIFNYMTIIGNGAENTIIDGNGGVLGDNVFGINGSAGVSISGVTIQHGNFSGDGGGIGNYNGALTLTNSTISSNTSQGLGGGIFVGGSGELRLINSSVSGNSAGQGGGISIYTNTSSTLTGSTVSGNNAQYFGGGIFIGGGGFVGTLSIIDSTISSNHSNTDGGGIYNDKTTSTRLYNVTVSQNTANADASGVGIGGGVVNAAVAGDFTFQNSIIAQNRNVVSINGVPVLNPEDCAGTLTSQGNNIMYDTTDCTVNGTVTIADPNLGPLASNGGPTDTQALLSGSPAIDAGNSSGCTDNLGVILTSDQRGFHRPVNGGIALRCDIGAFEYYPDSLFLSVIMR
jgi:CSLREA domain-containing protein